MKDLKGRVAVVTGAASGIGRALAERLVSEEVKIVLADLDGDTLRDVAESIGQSSDNVLAVQTDVTQPDSLENLADAAFKKFGAVHLLCNNAGIGGTFAWTWDQPLEVWQGVLNVNLLGVIHGIRAFLPRMLAQDSEGHIVNTASIAGLISVPFLAPYHVTKHGIVTLSESLHFELAMLGAKLKVSVFCPGFVRTPIATAMGSRRTELAGQSSTLVSEPEAWHLAWQELLEGAPSPTEVIGCLIEAIRDEQFYVFPAPELTLLAEPRMDAILDQRNPELSLPPEIISVIEKHRT